MVTLERTILATLVYIVKDGKTLMIHRCKRDEDQHKGKYNGLGGKFERGESPLECAKREVLEESGLHIHDVSLKGTLFFPEFDKHKRDWMVFVYRADHFSGNLQKENPEGTLEWIANDQVLSLPLWEGDRHFLKYLHTNDVFDGKFLYQNNQLVEHTLTLLPAKN